MPGQHEDRATGLVTLTGLRSLPSDPSSFIASYTSAFLYEWTLDPKTGQCVSERYLSATPAEVKRHTPAPPCPARPTLPQHR